MFITSHNKTSHIPLKLVSSKAFASAPAPLPRERLKLRILILMGLLFMFQFLWWFFSDDRHIGNTLLYWLLTAAMLFKMLRWIHEWYHYFNITVPDKPEMKTAWSVDMFTTYCAGEPKEMVKQTLLAMIGVTYHHETYLCDEADDSDLKNFCAENGIHHITRTIKIDAKAGNINNALQYANGDICVILDPDHTPVPQFLDRTLPYFEDDKVGFVQCVQGYRNQNESVVANAAAEQTYHFYGPLMMGMHQLGTAQAIGANCTFRRVALDSIGGHAAGLSEDMHTSMQLHAEGWKSIYIPEMLTKGLVPSTLTSFYQQQLKWSRGTFELLLFTYPRLFRKFSFTQKIHYFFLPLYYMFGFIALIDILIPSLSLLRSDVAWKLDMKEFAIVFLPLFFITLFIRMYAQKWLIEKKERGLHILGGLLRLGTWWIFITGFITTIFRVKIPYIPTSKDDSPRNVWLQSIPNLLLVFFGIFAIWYGLRLDWTPYSIAMAGFAGFNCILILTIVLLSQQRMIQLLMRVYLINKLSYQLIYIKKIFYDKSVILLRKGAFAAGIVILFLSLINAMIPPLINKYKNDLSALEKDYGGFYTGIYMPVSDRQNSIDAINNVSKTLATHFDIVSIYQQWGPQSINQFPAGLLYKIRKAGSIPMITWEPYSHSFPEFKNDKGLSADWRVFEAILKGRFDNYLTAYAAKIKDYGEPVMIRFAHEMDNPSYPWSFYGGGNTPEEFIHAHQYVVKFFNKMGATNVTWVWNPWEEDNLEKYYPGDDFVDWIGVTNLNYGLANSNGKWVSFEDLYKPFHDLIVKYKKPVMLSEFGSTNFGGDRGAWMKDAFEKIKEHYKEIRSVVFFYSDEDKNWGVTKWRPENGAKIIDWTFHNDENTIRVIKEEMGSEPFNTRPVLNSKLLWQDIKKANYTSPFVKGTYPDFQLTVNGADFFIKGVAYNVNQDWRDVNDPLTRKKLERDFQLIREMGANTIRRYAAGIYDENVLTIANENKLKVLYGFWFDADKNYLNDSIKLKEYEEEVIASVKKYKDQPAILGWSLGNEVWGLLKQSYGQPYLTLIRKEYALYIEKLAREIHSIDPNHPVFTVAENTKHLPGEVSAYFHIAPSVDVIGVNSYYEEQISILPNIQYMCDTTRPYLVSEFGPHGYWDSYFSEYNENGRVIENSGNEKALLYSKRWTDYIEGRKGMNIGGIAYTWQDRQEGTATWFGITDIKGRLKPTYYAMKEKWTGTKDSVPISDVYIYIPAGKIKAGNSATFYAVTEKLNQAGLKYEWKLANDDIMEIKTNMVEEDDGRRVTFTIPAGETGLRLYLFVTNEAGKDVNTASLPILK